MKRRSGAARSVARAAGGAGEGGGLLAGGVPADAAAPNSVPPPLVAPRWPARALFRWEERAGPSEAWDSLPFPPGGPGLLGRLRAAAASSELFRARRGEGVVPALTMSVKFNVLDVLQLLPLISDEGVEKVVQLWQMAPGSAGGVIAIAVREDGGGAGGGGLPAPPPFLRAGRGLLPPRPPPALGNALPVEMWACIFNAIGSSRCVGGGTTCHLLIKIALRTSFFPRAPPLPARSTRLPGLTPYLAPARPRYICLSPRDAAALACVLANAAEAHRAGRWNCTIRTKRSGAVLEPASGAFDVTVAPGTNIQAAVDRCPRGGSVLLLPGTHEGPLVLSADQEVHVFGRGQATLRVVAGTALTCTAAKATVDGLFIRREGEQLEEEGEACGVFIRGGAVRLQACEVSSTAGFCISIEGAGTDPMISDCK